MLSIDFIKEWCINKIEYLKNQALKERTSWDGIVIIGIGTLILIASPLTKIAAFAAIGYGVFTILKDEGMF